MVGRHDVRNCFLDHVPQEIRTQHARTFEDNAYFFPELLSSHSDRSIFEKLRGELVFAPTWLDNGMPFSRQLCVGSDSLLATSPTFRQLISQLVRHFRIEPVRSLVNLYRNGGDWCNLHSDQYDAGHCGINFTIGASFGEERVLIFEEKVRGELQKAQIAIVQRNGDVHAFGEAVNERWRHGIPRCSRSQSERISIMLWGYVGEDSAFSDGDIFLSGTFPHLLSYDPKVSKTPRVCEGCGQTREQLGGKVDLDHRWCCATCWQAHDRLGWVPLSSTEPSLITDCLTIQGAQLAVAILAGRKVVECRKSEFPAGWYALQIAKRVIDPWESRRVEEQWPTVPKEHELPHEAVVGIIHVSPIPVGQQLAKDCPWVRPGHCYMISKVVPLQRTLPTRSPGSCIDPWRLSPAAKRSIVNLIEGQPVYDNPSPDMVAAPDDTSTAAENDATTIGQNGDRSSTSSWWRPPSSSYWDVGWYHWHPPVTSISDAGTHSVGWVSSPNWHAGDSTDTTKWSGQGITWNTASDWYYASWFPGAVSESDSWSISRDADANWCDAGDKPPSIDRVGDSDSSATARARERRRTAEEEATVDSTAEVPKTNNGAEQANTAQDGKDGMAQCAVLDGQNECSEDPWGSASDPWSMALEKGRRFPAKKVLAPTASADVAWNRYRA